MNDLGEHVSLYYDFGDKDRQTLRENAEFVDGFLEEFLDSFYKRIFLFSHARTFLSSDEIIQFHREKIALWYRLLFSGVYDDSYFNFIQNISQTHVKIALPSHYVNASFSFVRIFFNEITHKYNKPELMNAINKILDINLDLLTRTQSDGEYEKLLETIMHLRNGLQKERIVPFFQPIVCAKSGRVIKYEALARLLLPDGKILAPNAFLGISQKIGLYPQITRAIVSSALKIFALRQDSVSINLSTQDIFDTSTRAFLLDAIHMFPEPARVTIEFLESEELIFNSDFMDFVNSLKGLGVKFAIDDFGSGFSNYQNLSSLPIDMLKIDGSLIKDIDTNHSHRLTVESIQSLASKLGIESVAEFVATESIAKVIADMGITFAQGYFYGAPEPHPR